MKRVLFFPATLLLLATLVAAQSSQSGLQIDQLKIGADRASVLAGLAQNYTLSKASLSDLDLWTWQEKDSARRGTLWFANGKLGGFTERLGDFSEGASKLAKRIYSELYWATEPSANPTADYLGQREAIAQITVRDEHLPTSDDRLLFINIPNKRLELRLTIGRSSVKVDRITTR